MAGGNGGVGVTTTVARTVGVRGVAREVLAHAVHVITTKAIPSILNFCQPPESICKDITSPSLGILLRDEHAYVLFKAAWMVPTFLVQAVARSLFTMWQRR